MNRGSTTVDGQPWLWGVFAAAILTGLVLFISTKYGFPFLALPELPELGINPKNEDVKFVQQEKLKFHVYNAALLFGLLGCCLGITTGLLAILRRKMSAVVGGGLGGLLLGAVGGAAAGYFVHRTLWLSESDSLVRNFGIHLLAWGPAVLGAIGGVMITQCSLSKGIAKSIGTVIAPLMVVGGYCLFGSILFQNANFTQLYPDKASSQMLWHALSPVLLGLGLALALRGTANQPAAATTSNEQKAD